MSERTLSLANEEEMVSFGQTLAEKIQSPAVIFLQGNLGAGKTTLMKGILRGLGHAGSVKSPTYTLVEEYKLDSVYCYHFDLYRLAEPEELEWVGIRDYIRDDSICCMEWPEKAEGFLPVSDISVEITPLESGRALDIKAHTDRGKSWIEKINT